MNPINPPAAVRHESAPLPSHEREKLRDAEALLALAEQSYISQGKSLREINTKRLYRATHPSFEDYCRQKWEISRQNAYTLIACYETIEHLFGKGFHEDDLPRNVTQCRELLRLEKLEDRAEAWAQAIAAADRITSEDVRSAVSRVILATAEKRDRERTGLKVAEESVIEAPEPEPTATHEQPEMSPAGDTPEEGDPRVLRLRESLPGKLHAALEAQVVMWDEVQAAYKGPKAIGRRALQEYEKGGHPSRGLAYELRRFITLEPPENWRLCLSVDQGGCGGQGAVPGIGDCLKCGGLGFRMSYKTK